MRPLAAGIVCSTISVTAWATNASALAVRLGPQDRTSAASSALEAEVGADVLAATLVALAGLIVGYLAWDRLASSRVTDRTTIPEGDPRDLRLTLPLIAVSATAIALLVAIAQSAKDPVVGPLADGTYVVMPSIVGAWTVIGLALISLSFTLLRVILLMKRAPPPMSPGKSEDELGG